MKTIISAILLITSLSTSAQELVGGKLVKKIEIDDIPSYFFKVRPDGSLISYTVPYPGRNPALPGKNKILDLKTGEITEIPGPHDPVFIGDLDLVIIPTSSHSQYEIFSIEDVLSSGKRPLAVVKSLKGYYQSTAVMKSDSSSASIRVIAEQFAKNHSVIDFKYNKSAGITVDDSKDKILCADTNFKLPMLSKDGKYVGGLDLDTNTSGVWEIVDNYKCKKIIDLGIKTGKLNFNFDNSKLTYHIYKKIGGPESDNSDVYVPIPEPTNIANIYVYDIKTGKHTLITRNSKINSLYPDFTRDGRLVFVNHPHKDDKVSFSFIKL